MPLMVYDYPVNGGCSMGYGVSTSLISLTAASLTIYYQYQAQVAAMGTNYNYYYFGINAALIIFHGI